MPLQAQSSPKPEEHSGVTDMTQSWLQLWTALPLPLLATTLMNKLESSKTKTLDPKQPVQSKSHQRHKKNELEKLVFLVLAG